MRFLTHFFAPFNNLLTPPSMPYSQYYEVYQLSAHQEPNMLYLNAARDFGRARQLFESVSAIGKRNFSTQFHH